jgi:hypothetical protein
MPNLNGCSSFITKGASAGNTGTEGSDIGVVLDTKSKKEKER